MQKRLDNGWLTNVRRVESPNCDERPENVIIDLIVIHAMSLPPGQFGGPYIDQLFTNSLERRVHPYFSEIEKLQVSAHILIQRNGDMTQYVPFNRRAWHAGKSCYSNKEHCNDFSIGIELEGCDEVSFTAAQYKTLAGLLSFLMAQYKSITADRICGHSDIAPGRKTDPGPAFDWQHLRRLLITPSDSGLNREQRQ